MTINLQSKLLLDLVDEPPGLAVQLTRKLIESEKLLPIKNEPKLARPIP